MTWPWDPPRTAPSPMALTFSFCTWLSPRIILDDILITTTANVDHALLFKFPDDFNNALLRCMDILDFHRTHNFHFFLHHFDASAGHVAEELLLLLLCCTLQRGRDRFLVHALQDLPNRRVIEHFDILEYKHQFANGIGDFGFTPIDLFKHCAAFPPIHPV